MSSHVDGFAKGGGMTNEQEYEDSENELPETVNSAIRIRYGPVPDVPPETDRAILADARRHLSARIRPARRFRRWTSWHWAVMGSTVAAASVVLLVWKPAAMQQNAENAVVQKSATQQIDRNDVDENGRVDILDAFAMARLIRDGGTGTRDLNGDGRFDRLDVDLVARKAVML